MRTIIESWETGALIRDRAAPTTRGWNGYSGNQHRAFKYLTEKKRLTANDLVHELAQARSYHLICSPLRTIDQVEGVLLKQSSRKDKAVHDSSNSYSIPGHDQPPASINMRPESKLGSSRPLFIWEPVPDLCTPEELGNTFKALRYVDVVSPNHEELASIFSYKHPAEGISKEAIEDHAQRLLHAGIGPHKQGAVVVRAGAQGCFVLSPTQREWLPAYHTDASRVKDPTGGGNGFLGGLAVGLIRTKFDVVEAAKWGSVAASFTIEQVGMPKLTRSTNDDETQEKWNGASVQERLAEYQRRTV